MGARDETPEALGTRFLQMMDSVGSLHPLLDTWTWGDMPEIDDTDGKGGSYPLVQIRGEISRRIARNASRVEEGVRDPVYGYFMAVMTARTPHENRVHVTVSTDRSSSASAFANRADFGVKPNPDPTLMTYELWRAVMLILCETWEATWAEAAPFDIRPHWSGIPVRVAWMNYVSPRFAPLVALPGDVIAERRANGGLFLAATDETFQASNPAHMAAARRVEAACQPLNRLAWPIDDPYM